ncbi:pollen-specific leucine-rich repeat extensin-like protein 1 [Phragmites australis]|uniref:pollen-specific leucine-rich repeat extensin-like protein 1 n=1 Tax=Phragmites australis TaxID=29695 RepID=UPI002D7A1A65|nr:pollen-specific leucine-rich repeat extensin-like protein 1 [Phragmites australis]
MSGSGAPSGRGSRGFDFGTDDVLCSYDNFADPSDPKRPDPVDKDFHDSRLGRPFVKVYEQESYGKEDVLSAVEKCMKKYADNLLRSLEGITSRLSQLEIYCYKLERSICKLRSDVLCDETDQRLKSLEKHLNEVHRSIQILRDKQELAETQKELAKFQLTQDSSKKKEDVPTPSLPEPRKFEEKPDTSDQQLALVLPHQVNSPSLAPRASEPVQQYKDQPVQQPAPTPLVPQQDRYLLSQAIVYYPQRQAPGIQDTQGQQLQPEVQYLPARTPAQDVPAHASAQQPQAANQTQPQSYPPYQQQWHQQSSQPTPAPVAQPQQTFSQPFPPPAQQPQLSNVQQFPPQPMHQAQSNAQQYPPPPVHPQQSNPQLPPQAMQPHPPVQTHMRPQTPPNYPRYPPHQPLNPTPETLPGNVAMQGQYNTVAPSGGSHSEVPYSYGGPGIPPTQPPPQHSMQRHQLAPSSQGSFGPPPSKESYAGPRQYAPQGNTQGYNTGYGYPPSGLSRVQAPQMPPGGGGMRHPGSHTMHSHPYGEMIERAITMGYPRDQVLNMTQRMAESGQQMDFNSLLDRLNEAGPGAPPRAW